MGGSRERGSDGKDGRVDERPTETHAPEQLREYLHCWTLPGGKLTPEQARALLAWDETPADERPGLRASLAMMQQQVPARSLAPNQRRGHASWLDRLKGFFRP